MVKKKTKKKVERIVVVNEITGEKRKLFIAAYVDPGSPTFDNAYKSAVKAGFSDKYSRQILNKNNKWLLDIVRNTNMIDESLEKIRKHVNIKTLEPVMTAFGPYKDKKTKKMLYHEDSKLLKIQQDAAMFVLEKLHPDFKKKDKFEIPPGSIEFKQIIIIAPNGDSIPYNQTNREAIPSVSIPTE